MEEAPIAGEVFLVEVATEGSGWMGNSKPSEGSGQLAEST